jgi:hypothetical protein
VLEIPLARIDPAVLLATDDRDAAEPLIEEILRRDRDAGLLSLSGCRAADWLARPEPVAWALAALMDPGA